MQSFFRFQQALPAKRLIAACLIGGACCGLAALLIGLTKQSAPVRAALVLGVLTAALVGCAIFWARSTLQKARQAAAYNSELIALNAALQEEIQERRRVEEALTAHERELTVQREELEQGAQSLVQTNALFAQASDRFQELFQGLPVSCVCYDRQGRIMEWNRAFEGLYGLDNVFGQSIWEMVYSRAEAPQIAEAVAAVLNGQGREGIEWTHQRMDGSLAHLYCSLFPLRDVDGEIIGGISADVDISAQQQAEEALGESEERLHTLYNTTSQQSLSFEDKTAALLHMGCLQFGLEVGILTHYQDERQVVIQASSLHNITFADQILPTEMPLGEIVLARLRTETFAGADVCLTATVRVNEQEWGTLCFAGILPQSRLFSSGDRELIRLMAQWIGGEIGRRQAEEAVRESEERFRIAIASMSEGLILMDAEGMVRLCNESAERILGMTSSEIHGWRPLNPDFHALREDGTPFPEGSYPLVVALRNGQPQRNVVMGLPRQEGSLLWISVNSKPLFRNGSAAPHAIVATFSDITERRRCDDQLAAQMTQIMEYTVMLESQKAQLEAANSQLETLARQDGLTGLGNRRAFQERLELELGRADRYRLPLSLILLDVDGFKGYNDTFGHQAGDEVLKTLARTLQDQGRDTDFFARYGGEEFIVLLPHTDSQGAVTVAERLRTVLENVSWMGRPVTASFGVATLRPAMQNQQDLISEADAALYAAKTGGRNQVIHAHSLADPPSDLAAH